MSRPTRDTAAGRAYLDLQNRARRERRGTQELLTMYVVERWLARLAESPRSDDFILKGGMLLAAFGGRRPTVDADALARNMSADQDAVTRLVAEIASIELDDGVDYLADTARSSMIRDDALYSGVRVVMVARIATAQVKLQLDINFGDPVTPAPRPVQIPSLRESLDPVRITGYPVETVLAEKIATAIDLGEANTRVRDWADIYSLTGNQEVVYDEVRAALEATASFRDTELKPLATEIGALVTARDGTYRAYRKQLGTSADDLPESFNEVVAGVITFADPVIDQSAMLHRWNTIERRWDLETGHGLA
jgi:hypothetical protein